MVRLNNVVVDKLRLVKGPLVDGVVAGCFPQLYTALGPNAPDQVITL